MNTQNKKSVRISNGHTTFAKVRENARWARVTACSGAEFVKGEARAVPIGFEAEAERHPDLEVKVVEMFVDAPSVAPVFETVAETSDLLIELPVKDDEKKGGKADKKGGKAEKPADANAEVD